MGAIVLDLSSWAHWVVEHWQAWSHAFWRGLFALLNIAIPPYWVPLLTFSVFALMIAVGQMAAYATAQRNQSVMTAPDAPAIGWRRMALAIAGPLAITAAAVIVLNWTDGSLPREVEIAAGLIIPVAAQAVPLGLIIHASQQRIKAVTAFAMIIGLYGIMAALPTSSNVARILEAPLKRSTASGNFLEQMDRLGTIAPIILVSYVLIVLIPPLMLAIAPINALWKRLSFLAVGLMALIGLNELSKYADAVRKLLGFST